MRTITFFVLFGIVLHISSCIVEKEFPVGYKYINETDKEILIEAFDSNNISVDQFQLKANQDTIFTYGQSTTFLNRFDVDSVCIIFNSKRFIYYSCTPTVCNDQERNILITSQYENPLPGDIFYYYITKEDYENAIPLPN